MAYEPGSAASSFVFPEHEPRPVGSIGVPLSDFMKLTRIPIHIVYGDFLPKSGGNIWQQQWRQAANVARDFADAINHSGGDAQVFELPDIGLKGNTHFPFADLNNEQVADQMSRFLHVKGLDSWRCKIDFLKYKALQQSLACRPAGDTEGKHGWAQYQAEPMQVKQIRGWCGSDTF